MFEERLGPRAPYAVADFQDAQGAERQWDNEDPELGSMSGVSQIGVSQIGVSQIGVSQIGVSHIGVSHIGVSHIGVSHIGVDRASPKNSDSLRRDCEMTTGRLGDSA